MSFPPPPSDQFRKHLDDTASQIDAALIAALQKDHASPPRLKDAMRHAVLSGGKRVRPFLVLETAALCGAPFKDAIATATALECLHCYSLAHDDLPAMDNDTLRRGQPTVWSAFDDWTAILVGDALLTLAFELIAAPTAHPDPATRSALCHLLAQAAGPSGMVGGQYLDLAAEKCLPPDGVSKDQSVTQIERLQSMKTGALIRFSCEAGARIARAPEAHRAALVAYGTNLGLAFQIADDLLDVEGDTATVGKQTGKDAARGKATLVSLMGLSAARAKLHDTHAAAHASLAPFGAKADHLRALADFVVTRNH